MGKLHFWNKLELEGKYIEDIQTCSFIPRSNKETGKYQSKECVNSWEMKNLCVGWAGTSSGAGCDEPYL